MKAIGFDRYLPAEDSSSFLELNLTMPVAEDRDLLVRVMAISMNPVDAKVRSRTEGVLDEPGIAGWDVAGTDYIVCLNDVSGLIDNGSLRTTMTQSCGSLTTENLRMAHSLIETGRTIGKIVLSGIPE